MRDDDTMIKRQVQVVSRLSARSCSCLVFFCEMGRNHDLLLAHRHTAKNSTCARIHRWHDDDGRQRCYCS